MDRRRFIAAAAALPIVLTNGCRRDAGRAGGGSPLDAPCAVPMRTAESAKSLSADEWRVLDAASARILPRDADAGAADAHVVNFIDEQLGLPAFASFLKSFQWGLARLDLAARKRHQTPFVRCSEAVQDALLKQLAAGDPRVGGGRGARFFQLLLTFSLEGFLCDPVYGGNHGHAGWRVIGFEPRPPRPRCPYGGSG